MVTSNPRDLAILGGRPAFSTKLVVGRPNIPNRGRFLQRVESILDRRWLTNRGYYVQEFERQLAGLLGVKHCICVCNGTLALELAIRATGLSGEVIVPSFTFIATAHALQWQNIKPVFCDVDPRTHNMDPRQVEQLLTPKTTGILGVHLWGRPCDVTALTGIAQRHNLRLIFDAAHALRCSHNGRMIGSFGDAEVFSFHATKFLNTFEGGAITTNDSSLAHKLRLSSNFGFSALDSVSQLGTNAKMSEISAAMGLTGLEAVEETIEINRCRHLLYKKQLERLPGVRVLDYDGSEQCNYQYVVVEMDENARLSRDELLAALWAENVLARRYFYPGCHRMEPYRSLYPDAASQLSATERLAGRVLTLPTGTAVSESDILSVCRIIASALANAPLIRERLTHRSWHYQEDSKDGAYSAAASL